MRLVEIKETIVSCFIYSSDLIIPGLLEFPENQEFPGIQSNLPGIPGNLLKAAVSFDFSALLIRFWVQMLILSLLLAILIPKRIVKGL